MAHVGQSGSWFVRKKDTYELRDKLTDFYPETGKLSLSTVDALLFIEDVKVDQCDISRISSTDLKMKKERVALSYAPVSQTFGHNYQQTNYADHRLHVVVAAGIIRHSTRAALVDGPDKDNLYNLDTRRLDWQQAAFEAQRLKPERRQLYTANSLRPLWPHGFMGTGGNAHQSLIAPSFEFLRGKYSV